MATDADRSGNPSTSYMYDIERLSRHLADSDVPREPAAELVQTAVRTNACLALCDAQLDLLQMWCAFVRTLRARHPNALLPPGRAQSVGTQSHDGVLDLCRACALWLEKETRESTVLDLFATEMTNLMLALLTGWLAQSPALPAAFAPAVAALAGSLSRLSRRSSDASALLMASTPAASESSAPVPPQLAGRHTLLSTLACATRCVVSADDAALADDAFHTACVALVTPACELLERALQADDYCVALSCVQLSSALCDRVRSTNASHFGAVLVFVEFARRELEARLLALLARLLEQATLPTLASAVLELLRVVCERDRETAERLFVAGALKLLAPARVPRGLRDGYEPYRLSGVGGGGRCGEQRQCARGGRAQRVARRVVRGAATCRGAERSAVAECARSVQSAAAAVHFGASRERRDVHFDESGALRWRRVGGDAAASAPSNVTSRRQRSRWSATRRTTSRAMRRVAIRGRLARRRRVGATRRCLSTRRRQHRRRSSPRTWRLTTRKQGGGVPTRCDATSWRTTPRMRAAARRS
jgi:hypothetical protein